MNSNQEVNTVETAVNTHQDELVTKKPKNYSALIFIACLLLSFVVWCCAQYVHDPIIQKDMVVNFVLINGETNEAITPQFHMFTFYGLKSELENKSVINIEVDRSLFTSYDTYTTIPISYTDKFHSHTTEIELRLIVTSKGTNDETSDK